MSTAPALCVGRAFKSTPAPSLLRKETGISRSSQDGGWRAEAGGGGGGGGNTLPTITRSPRGSGHAAHREKWKHARACIVRVRACGCRDVRGMGLSVNMKSSFCKVNFKVKYQQVEVIPRYRCEVGDSACALWPFGEGGAPGAAGPR